MRSDFLRIPARRAALTPIVEALRPYMIRSFRQNVFIISYAYIATIARRSRLPGRSSRSISILRRPPESFSGRNQQLTEIRERQAVADGEYVVYARKVAGYPDFDTLNHLQDARRRPRQSSC